MAALAAEAAMRQKAQAVWQRASKLVLEVEMFPLILTFPNRGYSNSYYFPLILTFPNRDYSTPYSIIPMKDC